MTSSSSSKSSRKRRQRKLGDEIDPNKNQNRGGGNNNNANNLPSSSSAAAAARPTKKQKKRNHKNGRSNSTNKKEKKKSKTIQKANNNNNNNNNSNLTMTPNAVRKMLLAEPYDGPLIVGLVWPDNNDDDDHDDDEDDQQQQSNDQKCIVCRIFDATMQASVLLAKQQPWVLGYQQQQQCEEKMKRSHSNILLVEITGYISSTVNGTATSYPAFQPFLCVTQSTRINNTTTTNVDWEDSGDDDNEDIIGNSSSKSKSKSNKNLLALHQHHHTHTLNEPPLPGAIPTIDSNSDEARTQRRRTEKLPGGASAANVKAVLEYTTDAGLFLSPPANTNKEGCRSSNSSRLDLQQRSPQHEPEFESNRSLVQDFWRHHTAMQTLQDSNVLLHPNSRSNSVDLTHHRHAIINNAADDDDADSDAADGGGGGGGESTNNQDGDIHAASSLEQVEQPPPQQPPQHELYFAALKEFSQSQIDRQTASLTSNLGKATAKVAVQVVEQHKETHDQVMLVASERNRNDSLPPPPASAAWLTLGSLQKWHQTLCGNGLHENPGEFRQKTVKAGRTVFLRPSQVVPDLETNLLPALATLEQRLRTNAVSSSSHHHHHHNEQQQQAALACLTFGAAVFFGVVDAHPFSDGNGRLARLLGNAAMRSMGLPFCVNWFATPAQRREYVLATLMTRRNLTLVYRGNSSSSSSSESNSSQDNNDAEKMRQRKYLQDAMGAAGMYFPLVALLMDRVRKAIPEFVQLQHEKQLSLMEHEESKAARRVRERAAAGSCMICFDDSPNIATLCCGKAVHLNCIAEWLSNNTSCPNCRGILPKVPARPERVNFRDFYERALAQQHELETGEDDTTTDDTEVDTESDDTEFLEDNPTSRSTVDNNWVDRLSARLRRNELELRRMHQDDDDDDSSTDYDSQNSQGSAISDSEEESRSGGDDATTSIITLGHFIQRELQEYASHDDTTNETDDTEVDDDQESDNGIAPNDDTASSAESTGSARLSDSNGNSHVTNCDHCRNTAAQECTNSCCGLCCILHGLWECHRHGG